MVRQLKIHNPFFIVIPKEFADKFSLLEDNEYFSVYLEQGKYKWDNVVLYPDHFFINIILEPDYELSLDSMAMRDLEWFLSWVFRSASVELNKTPSGLEIKIWNKCLYVMEKFSDTMLGLVFKQIDTEEESVKIEEDK